MLVNTLIGACIPLLICLLLYKRNPQIIVAMYPFGVAVAFLANDWGFTHFWMVTPYKEPDSISAMPFNLGYFPLMSCLIIVVKYKLLWKSIYLILLFTTIGTCLEGFGVLVGKIIYLDGWNIFYTSLIYFSSFTLAILYSKVLMRYHMLPKI
ncbi:hypothetical protein [Thalassobacillus hwangdonensis]|uniref:Uncharacterized protein n=1 Tax=Thalassobacillus hwangdonensis TaxID=546108 RepID=A0ABW3KUW9_9BACI